MKAFAESLYKSKAWQDCRSLYLQSVNGYCERCLIRGQYTPAVIVHHRVYLTPENVADPSVALNPKNLEALCQDCHNKEHITVHRKRYAVRPDGTVEIPPVEK